MKKLAQTNDFVVKFSNVNGSGSASANELFARAILRMGVPVSPRNIFPSNIQGLPTWYEVRISEAGWSGCRGGVDLMVAMNPQTWETDCREIEPGGYLLYDSTRPARTVDLRPDINAIGIPITKLCFAKHKDVRQRQLLKNIVYVGALVALLEIDLEIVCGLIREQFAGKEELLEANIKALRSSYAYTLKNEKCPLGLRIQRSDEIGERIFIDGNNAAALGCVYGGATVCAWYPITPSSSLAEAFQRHCERYRIDPNVNKNRYAVVQAEDEIASIGIAIGAGWNGARAFTATSGPGISLMTEFIGLAYFAEIPVTIIDVQRGGPSTGMPTRVQQGDLLTCAYASHGDTKHVLLFPADPHECFEHAAHALDLADRLQTPVFVLTDLDIGMNRRLCAPLAWSETRRYDRGKIMTREMLDNGATFGRYLDVDNDGIPYRTYPGTHPTKGGYFTRGTTKNAFAAYSEVGADYTYNMQRLLRKFETAKKLVPEPVLKSALANTPFGVIYFGSTSPAMAEALAELELEKIAVDALRVRAFPFNEQVSEFIADHDAVFVVEQNRDGQMRALLLNELDVDPAQLISILHYDGTPITARFIANEIAQIVCAMKGTDIPRPKDKIA